MSTSKRMVTAMVLAGGKVEGKYWALTLIKDKMMIEYVLDALKGAGIDDIEVVGLPDGYSFAGCRMIPGGKEHIDNIRIGLLNAAYNRVLICTCDTPAVTAQDIEDYLDACLRAPLGSLCFPVARMADCEARFHGLTRTTVWLGGWGTVTAGNFYYTSDRHKLLDRLDIVGEYVALKKETKALAKKLGILTAIMLYLSVKRGVKIMPAWWLTWRASRILRMKMQIVECPASLAEDVDDEAQLAAMERFM